MITPTARSRNVTDGRVAFRFPLQSNGDALFGWIAGLSWSPDSAQLAFTASAKIGNHTNPSSLYLFDTATQHVRELDTTSDGIYFTPPTWTVDGRLRAVRSTCTYACDGGPWGSVILDAATGERLASEPGAFYLDAGRDRTAFFTRLGAYRGEDFVPGGALFRHLPAPTTVIDAPSMGFTLAAAPSGNRLAAVLRQGLGTSLRYRVQPDGSGQTILGPEADPQRRLSPGSTVRTPSPDGRAVEAGPDGVFLIAANSERLLLSDLAAANFVVWSPDGSAVAFLAIDRSLPNSPAIAVAFTDGSAAYLLVGDAFPLDLIWTPDGIEYLQPVFGA